MGRMRAACLASLLLGPVAAQEPEGVPSFPVQTSAVVVDAVVLDGDRPVAGLTQADFTVLEDGRPQAIVAFEAHEAATAPARDIAAAEAQRVASNTDAEGPPGAAFGLLIDDLGLSPERAAPVKAAIAAWLRDKAGDGDEITLTTTSGDVWWNDRLDRGRADLLAVLERVKGKRSARAPSTPSMSEQEAYQITVNQPTGEADDNDPSRTGAASAIPRPGTQSRPLSQQSTSVLDRVANRWVDAGFCCWCDGSSCLDCSPPLGQCKGRVRMAAQEIQSAWTRRAQAVLGALERLADDLASMPGRRSILLVSEEFQRDLLIEDRARRAIDAAQRGNTSVYFVGALGLAGVSSYDVETRQAPRPGDMASMLAEQNVLATAGGSHLAEATGGVAVTDSNDLTAGLRRMAADSSVYYRLGYQPETAPDGKWHKLEVRVSRKGLKVRTARGHLARPPLASNPGRLDDGKPAARHAKQDASTAQALLRAGSEQDIPLRLACYVQAPDGAGAARVLIALELDGDRIRFENARGSLDLTIAAVERDHATVVPLDEILDLRLAPKDAGWLALFREIRLPPGVAQVRARVRDRASGAVGMVAERIDVPNVNQPYLSTPLLTDRVQPAPQPGEPPRLVPVARRRFRASSPLFCQYEMFGFGGYMLPGVPRVLGGYTLRAADGRIVVMEPLTLIASDGQRVVRRLTLELGRLQPGSYELSLTVEDQLAQRELTTRESFVIEGAADSGELLRRPAGTAAAQRAATAGTAIEKGSTTSRDWPARRSSTVSTRS